MGLKKLNPILIRQCSDWARFGTSSGKIFAETKDVQSWQFDPTIKYQARRRYAVPIYAFDNSSTYGSSSDSTPAFSDSKANIETITEDAKTQKHKILAGTNEEELCHYNPNITYGPLIQYIMKSTSRVEHKQVLYSGKTLAQTKDKNRWQYDPTIKYEARARSAVPIYAYDEAITHGYYSDSSTFASDSETEVIAEETHTQKFRIFVGTDNHSGTNGTKKKVRRSLPSIKDGPLLPFDAPRLSVDVYSSSESNTDESDSDSDSDSDFMTPTKPRLEGVTKEEELYSYDPNIQYGPPKRYVIPRCALSDDSSTDWSDSEFFASGASYFKTKIMAGEEAHTQKGKILSNAKEEQLFGYDLAKSPAADLLSVAEDLVVSSSTDIQSKPAVLDSTVLEVKHGAKSPAIGSLKDSEGAKETELYTGVKIVTDDN